MANRYYASIEIGGSVIVAQLGGIIERLPEYGLESIDVPPAVLPHMPPMARGRKPVAGARRTMMIAGTVRWGVFEALEAYLQAQGIPYDRFTEPVGNEEGILVRFRPETGVREYAATAGGERFVDAATLERAVQATRGRDDLIAWLRRHLGADVPPLPPLVVVRSDDAYAASPESA